MIDLPSNVEAVAKGFSGLDDAAKESILRELREMSPERRAAKISVAMAREDLESAFIRHMVTKPAQERVDSPHVKVFNPPDVG